MGHVNLGNGLESIKIQSQHILQMPSQVTSVYFHDRSWIAFQCWAMDVFVFISFSVNFWCILGRGVFLSFWHEAFVYLEVVALLGVARRFLFRYSPTIPPPCHTHSPVFLYLGNPYSCISVFVNALNSCFPLCEAKFDRLLVHSGICPPTHISISLQFLVHSPSRPAAPVSALGVLIQKFTIISIPGRADRKTAFVN